MYDRFEITNFRPFRHLELQGLKQVNLLVGLNNCGKTSLLEALALLADPASLIALARRRDEVVLASEEVESRRDLEEAVDLSYLFHGYLPKQGEFELKGVGPEVHRLNARVQATRGALILQLDGREPMDLELSEELTLPVQPWELRNGSRRPARHAFPDRGETSVPWQLIEPGGYSSQKLINQWGAVVLTAHEELVVEAVRLIDPTITRIAYVPEGRIASSASAKAGFWILREGQPRVPLGNLGDGIWRLLMIALSLQSASRGILLIDEIDSGLHYTVLERLWRLVLTTAARLDVQVFATTHSDDCWKALARVLEAEAGALDDKVSLQRLELGRPNTVVFPGEMIRIANQNQIEVR